MQLKVTLPVGWSNLISPLCEGKSSESYNKTKSFLLALL